MKRIVNFLILFITVIYLVFDASASLAQYNTAYYPTHVYLRANGFYYESIDTSETNGSPYADVSVSKCLYPYYYADDSGIPYHEAAQNRAGIYTEVPRPITGSHLSSTCMNLQVYQFANTPVDEEKDCSTQNLLGCIGSKFDNRFPFAIMGNLPSGSALTCPQVEFFGYAFDACFIYDSIKVLKYPVIVSLLIKILIAI